MLGHVVEPLATNDQNTLLLQYYIDGRLRARLDTGVRTKSLLLQQLTT